MQTDLVPKIVVYSTEKMEELIRLVEEDRQRSTDTGDTRYLECCTSKNICFSVPRHLTHDLSPLMFNRQGLKGAWLDLA